MLKRKVSADTREEAKRAALSTTTVVMSSSSENEATAVVSSDDSDFGVTVSFPQTYNYLDVSKIAAASIRYGVSGRATAAISTATLSAANDAGFLSTQLLTDMPVIDKNKILR